MELYIPQILLLLLSGVVIFSITPDLAPFTFMILALVVLVVDIPSILVLLLVGIVFFYNLPNMAPFTLMLVVVFILALAGWQHANMFADEYATSTWQNNIKGGGNTLLIITIVLMMIGFLLNMVGGGSSKISMPSVSSYSRALPEPPQFGTNRLKDGISTLKSILRDPFKTR